MPSLSNEMNAEQPPLFTLTPLFPRTRREKTRFLWVILGMVNFLAFSAHVLRDGTCTLFNSLGGDGLWVAGQYLAFSHGRNIPFTPTSYWFSYIHGWFFIVIHLVCMVVIWRLKKIPNHPPRANANLEI